MNMPTLPTDNLYKFMALSGTLILLLSLYLPSEYLIKLSDKNDAINSKIFTINAEIKYNMHRLSLIESIFKNSDNPKNTKNKLYIHYSQSEIKVTLPLQ